MNIIDWFINRPMPKPQPNPDLSVLIDLMSKGLVKLNSIEMEMKTMSAELDTLSAQVATNTSVVESAITLINGIAQRIIDAGTDPAALSALATSLQTEDNALAAAVAANTPVVPTP